MRIRSAVFLAGLTLAAAVSPAQARDIEFAGYTWAVRDGTGGPGPNVWDAANVWVAADGLHLRIVYANGSWHCAEVVSKQALGFGDYQFQLDARPDLFDRNVVLGFFNYAGPDGINEIDIEFAQWGNAANAGRLNWTVYPAQAGLPVGHTALPLQLNGSATTHRFSWTPSEVSYSSFHGWQTIDSAHAPIAQWRYAPAKANGVPQKPLPVHLNLWLDHGAAPVDHQPVEVVVRDFSFVPRQQP